MNRPCKLQINSAGAWRDVLRFDLDKVDVEVLQLNAQRLVEVADPEGRTGLRIATADALQHALIRWDAKTGWRNA